ncbi:hypothetical protein [Alkalicoccus chagannorensis]|uniref:hypothetical protein n=1 Tax=Alkalicoccus chagannorensis TaxID=427072 RepID=UPI00041D170D|nr:hypothetical protein [Alkalicoccus chagannorensis]
MEKRGRLQKRLQELHQEHQLPPAERRRRLNKRKEGQKPQTGRQIPSFFWILILLLFFVLFTAPQLFTGFQDDGTSLPLPEGNEAQQLHIPSGEDTWSQGEPLEEETAAVLERLTADISWEEKQPEEAVPPDLGSPFPSSFLVTFDTESGSWALTSDDAGLVQLWSLEGEHPRYWQSRAMDVYTLLQEAAADA